MSLKDFFGLLRDAAKAWSADKASRQAAALAYYSIFAIAPLIALIVIAVGRALGDRFNREQVLERIIERAATGMDPETLNTVAEMVANFMEPAASPIATIFSLVMMLFAASGLLAQVQQSLDVVWNVEPDPDRGIMGMVKDRLVAASVVGVAGLLLLATLLASTIINAAGEFLSQILPFDTGLLSYLDPVLTFALVTLLFAAIFKILPRVEIAWRDVWVGALLTALLFTAGKLLIGFYLGRSNPGTAFGAAGSVILILLWIYYSAQIFLYGAEFTKVYANRFGSRIVPDETAQFREAPAGMEGIERAHPALPAPAHIRPAQAAQPSRPEPEPEPSRFSWLLTAAAAFILGMIAAGRQRQ